MDGQNLMKRLGNMPFRNQQGMPQRGGRLPMQNPTNFMPGNSRLQTLSPSQNQLPGSTQNVPPGVPMFAPDPNQPLGRMMPESSQGSITAPQGAPPTQNPAPSGAPIGYMPTAMAAMKKGGKVAPKKHAKNMKRGSLSAKKEDKAVPHKSSKQVSATMPNAEHKPMHKKAHGGKVKKYAGGGSIRGSGCEIKGRTRGINR